MWLYKENIIMLKKYMAILTAEINQAERQFMKEVKRHKKRLPEQVVCEKVEKTFTNFILCVCTAIIKVDFNKKIKLQVLSQLSLLLKTPIIQPKVSKADDS